ncbi:protein bicaudal C homolog 1-like isoform X2 [Watersipora subatra]|uniref:protein bicaudal C homolog 1-like isoform X2 n=1 Tax=Watersipora subatra TaxID=2589382 RepID=UPI00355B8DBE
MSSPISTSLHNQISGDVLHDNGTVDTRNNCDSVNDPNQYEERFRVDRKKLEQMLHGGGSNGPITEAEDFFLEVMDSTNTHITWPSKLKIGAKSKKDPHIKVSGDPADVKRAKEKILLVLDTKSNRVTLKMDVSHTEHSHVIGKGGNNIKRVMEDTGCHIHFPDSNRNNQSDKSNQVSIAGQPYGVEKARQKIRDLLPVTFMFDVPLTGHLQSDQTSPVVNRLQQQYNVTIGFKQRPRSPATVAVVRGTITNIKALKEATILLMEHLTGSIGLMLPVNLQLDVAAQHHLFMIGRSGTNLQQIMARTGASICFPDPNAGLAGLKGSILITGSIDNILAAREAIIGCLPLVLMFDMKEDVECDQASVNTLMEKLDLFISVKPKPKQPSKSVIVKTIEDNVTSMYEARRLLLGLEKEAMPAVVSQFSRMQSSPTQGVLNPAVMMIPTSVAPNMKQTKVAPSLQTPQHKDLNENNSLTYNVNLVGQVDPCSGLTKPSSPQLEKNFLAKPVSKDSAQHLSNGSHYQPGGGSSTLSGLSTSPSSNMSTLASQPSVPHQPVDLEMLTKTLKKDLNLNLSGAHLMDSLGRKLHNSGSGADLRALQQRPIQSARSFSLSMSLSASRGSMSEAATGAADSRYDAKAPGIERLANRMMKNDRLMSSGNDHLMSSQNELLMASANRGAGAVKPPPGITQPPNGAVNPANVTAALADYERKKVMATKAIETEPSGEMRNPTDFWSGLGFSRSMPDSAFRDRLKQNGVRYGGPNMATTYEQQESEEDGDPWKDSAPNGNRISSDLIEKIEQYGEMLSTSLGRSNKPPHQVDSPQSPQYNSNTSDNSDMAELLRKLSLDKYTDLFNQQEIDLATFTTLNDQDLKEIGINTLGARKKMLAAIADLQTSRQKYFSPTPGSNNPFRSTSAAGGPFPQRHDIISHSGRW